MKKYWLIVMMVITFALVGCGETKKVTEETEKASEQTTEATTQTLSYLGTDYIIPATVDSIVTASLEAMEDAAVLGIKPVGVLEVAGEIPAYLECELAGATYSRGQKNTECRSYFDIDPDANCWNI